MLQQSAMDVSVSEVCAPARSAELHGDRCVKAVPLIADFRERGFVLAPEEEAACLSCYRIDFMLNEFQSVGSICVRMPALDAALAAERAEGGALGRHGESAAELQLALHRAAVALAEEAGDLWQPAHVQKVHWTEMPRIAEKKGASSDPGERNAAMAEAAAKNSTALLAAETAGAERVMQRLQGRLEELGLEGSPLTAGQMRAYVDRDNDYLPPSKQRSADESWRSEQLKLAGCYTITLEIPPGLKGDRRGKDNLLGIETGLKEPDAELRLPQGPEPSRRGPK